MTTMRREQVGSADSVKLAQEFENGIGDVFFKSRFIGMPQRSCELVKPLPLAVLRRRRWAGFGRLYQSRVIGDVDGRDS